MRSPRPAICTSPEYIVMAAAKVWGTRSDWRIQAIQGSVAGIIVSRTTRPGNSVDDVFEPSSWYCGTCSRSKAKKSICNCLEASTISRHGERASGTWNRVVQAHLQGQIRTWLLDLGQWLHLLISESRPTGNPVVQLSPCMNTPSIMPHM
jgi:hypothetical protein